MKNLVDRIQHHLWQDQASVTPKWLCNDMGCNVAQARAALLEAKDVNKGKVAIKWLLEGTTLASGERAVRVVPDDQTAEIRRTFAEVHFEQIYSMSPSVHATDATSLITGELEQTRSLFTKLLSKDAEGSSQATDDAQVNAFAQNSCSMVRGAPVVRWDKKQKQKAARHATAQDVPAPSKTQSAGAAGGATGKPPRGGTLASSFSGKPQPKAASAPSAQKPVHADETSQKEADSQQPDSQAEEKPAAGGKKRAKDSNPPAKSFGKSASKPKPAAKEAPIEAGKETVEGKGAGSSGDGEKVTAKRASAQILGDDDDDAAPLATQGPLPVKRRPGQQQLLDDSEDDFEDAGAQPKGQADAGGKAQPAETKTKGSNKTKAAAKKLKAGGKNKGEEKQTTCKADKITPDTADVEMSDLGEPAVSKDGETREQVKPAAKPESRAPGVENADNGNGHPEFGPPPHPDAAIVMVGSKAHWQYFNDKGAEVTVAAHKQSGGAQKAAKEDVVPSKRAKPEEEGTNAHTEQEHKGAKKKKTTKHAKAAVGAGDIRSLFGKRK